MKYSFDVLRQFVSGVASFITAALVTQIFDHEIRWALAFAIGLGTFVTSGFSAKEE